MEFDYNSDYPTVDDLRTRARRRVPRFAFGLRAPGHPGIEGDVRPGAEDRTGESPPPPHQK